MIFYDIFEIMRSFIYLYNYLPWLAPFANSLLDLLSRVGATTQLHSWTFWYFMT